MKTQIILPTGKLSYLRKINIELEMWGAHYDLLMIGDRNNYERVVLSILDDLMDEDAYQLTMQEMFAVFTLVKFQTLGAGMTVSWACNRQRTVNGSTFVCSHSNNLEYPLVDSLRFECPSNFKYKEFTMVMSGDEAEEAIVYLRPQTMEVELQLIEDFQKKGFSKADLLKDRKATNELLNLRIASAVTFKTPMLYDNVTSRVEYVMKALATSNTYSLRKEMVAEFARNTSYGFKQDPIKVVCEECGGTSQFRLPLSAGISF